MQSQITIIDYGMGNLRSVERKFQKIGATVEVTNDIKKISGAKKIVLPGVGHFGNAVKRLKETGIWELIDDLVIEKEIPILGICLGMQLLSNYSEEGNVNGFGWIDASVLKFRINDYLKYKVPHIGWNTINISKQSVLFNNVPQDALFYFVHSYCVSCNNLEDVLTTTNYEGSFVSSIQKKNIFGTQFHPEKSHEWGEQVLRNFFHY